MIIPIAHRINSIELSKDLNSRVGIEFDVHAYKDSLVISHDAFIDGEDFDEFIISNKSRRLAINIKEEGIEERVLQKLIENNVKDAFLFDICFPQCYRIGKHDKSRMGIRISQYERPDLKECSKFSTYLWVDTFDGNFWLEPEDIIRFKRLGYKICFVSPELHRPVLGDFKTYKKRLLDVINLLDDSDSICTKHIEEWL